MTSELVKMKCEAQIWGVFYELGGRTELMSMRELSFGELFERLEAECLREMVLLSWTAYGVTYKAEVPEVGSYFLYMRIKGRSIGVMVEVLGYASILRPSSLEELC